MLGREAKGWVPKTIFVVWSRDMYHYLVIRFLGDLLLTVPVCLRCLVASSRAAIGEKSFPWQPFYKPANNMLS